MFSAGSIVHDYFTLFVPIVIGEAIHIFGESQALAEPPLPEWTGASEKRDVAHLMGTLRLPGRGFATCCVALSLHVSVLIGGTQLFPGSLLLELLSRSLLGPFLWCLGLLVLIYVAGTVTRRLFVEEHRAKCAAVLHRGDREDWVAARQNLVPLMRDTRPRRWIPVGVGWGLIYLALLLALA